MEKLIIFILLCLAPNAIAQQSIYTNAIGLTLTTLPSVCNQGDLRNNTSDGLLYECGDSNNWTQVSSTSNYTFLSPLVNSSGTISIPLATSTASGYLSSTDWTTFNGKQSALSFGTTTESTSDVLTLSNWSDATVGSPTIQVKKATTSQDGYLGGADWATFNGKQATLTFNAPLSESTNTISASVPWAITAPTATTTGEIIKGASSQSNDLVDWENSTSTILSNVNASGQIGVGTSSPGAMLGITSSAATTIGAIIKGASSQSGDLTDWKNSTSTILDNITSSGQLGVGTSSPGAMAGLVCASSSTVGEIIKGASSQSSNLLDLENSTGTVLSEFNSSGELGIGVTSTSAMLTAVPASASTVGELIKGTTSQTGDLLDVENSTSTILTNITSAGKIGIGASSPGAMMQINTATSSTVGLIVKGASSQSGDLQDWENSAGTVLCSMNSSGSISCGGSSSSPIVMTVQGNPGTVSSDANIILTNIIVDTNSGYNTSTGVYTIPTTGYYWVGFFSQTSTPTCPIEVYVNGSALTSPVYINYQVDSYIIPGQWPLYLTAGNTVSWNPDLSCTLNSLTQESVVAIH